MNGVSLVLTVREVKASLQPLLSPPVEPSRMVLIYSGRPLDDALPLHSYIDTNNLIPDPLVIHLIVRSLPVAQAQENPMPTGFPVGAPPPPVPPQNLEALLRAFHAGVNPNQAAPFYLAGTYHPFYQVHADAQGQPPVPAMQMQGPQFFPFGPAAFFPALPPAGQGALFPMPMPANFQPIAQHTPGAVPYGPAVPGYPPLQVPPRPPPPRDLHLPLPPMMQPAAAQQEPLAPPEPEPRAPIHLVIPVQLLVRAFFTFITMGMLFAEGDRFLPSSPSRLLIAGALTVLSLAPELMAIYRSLHPAPPAPPPRAAAPGAEAQDENPPNPQEPGRWRRVALHRAPLPLRTLGWAVSLFASLLPFWQPAHFFEEPPATPTPAPVAAAGGADAAPEHLHRL
ncbi:hypothetical protein PAPYR_7747 [Paratrimastix pyriformis]|uniref:Ubiquitin-like domain-containing protein n=1 Tax=Paratrimastix pyriformis TaxID=342808 RepID=A0ABQ8UCB7_9EUKA|nr:hypothetical protein PAPYR_7747 [Paratrimastix pyriformis]